MPGLVTGSPERRSAELILRCDQPGVQSFNISGAVTPSRPDDTDPNQANDRSSLTVTVDCVIPIAVNIRPGNQGNVYNIQATTPSRWRSCPPEPASTGSAGVRCPGSGRLQPALRTAPEMVFGNRGGSVEKQGTVQIVDSFELDDRTKDGDDDVRAQFAREGTGLAPSDTEACVKGVVEVPGGGPFKFFGCDVLRMVP